MNCFDLPDNNIDRFMLHGHRLGASFALDGLLNATQDGVDLKKWGKIQIS